MITALADCGEANPDGSRYLATRVLTLSRDSSPLMRFPIKFLNEVPCATTAPEFIRVGFAALELLARLG